jgi:glycosyltransferase involved in cell wall biosynthesis
MNILVFSQYYPKPGSHSGVFIHNQNINLLKLGVNVTVLVPMPWAPKVIWFKKKWRQLGELPTKVNLDGVEVIYLKYPFLKPAKAFFLINATICCKFAYRFIVKNLLDRNFDLILARPLIPTGYSACLLSKRLNIPVVCEGTGSDVKIYPYYNNAAQKMFGKVLDNADKIIANAGNLSEEINAYAGRNICDVVYRGVNTEKFKPLDNRIEIRKYLGIDLDDRIILFIGNLSRAKGIYDLFSAFKTISEQFYKAKLYLIGPTHTDVKIKKLIRDQELNSKVRCVGIKPHNELPLWYNASDFLVLPSYSEGMPNVVFEAMACAKPVVATTVGGIPEVVEDGVSGLLVETGKAEKMAEAMQKLLTEDGLAESMGKKALTRITEKFVDAENVERVVQLLRKLIAVKKCAFHDN